AYISLDSLNDSTVGTSIGSLLLADLASCAGARLNQGGTDSEVNLFCDEVGEYATAGGPWLQLLNKSRSANFKVHFAFQTVSDLVTRAGSMDGALQMLGNANSLIALRSIDAGTQQFIAGNFGKTVVKSIAYSQSTNSIDGGNPTQFSGGYGERLTEVETDIFPPELLGQLPDLQFIANVSGGRLYKGRMPVLTLDKEPTLEEQFWKPTKK
ncbi:MAG: hypothetical protein AMS22_11435, partial [Thiotrichales bacterium SG8_50]